MTYLISVPQPDSQPNLLSGLKAFIYMPASRFTPAHFLEHPHGPTLLARPRWLRISWTRDDSILPLLTDMMLLAALGREAGVEVSSPAPFGPLGHLDPSA